VINDIMGKEFYPEIQGYFPAYYEGMEHYIMAGTDLIREFL
jgi:hypothetical protein